MKAAQLRAKHSLRTPDSIHAATAILAKADGILTNDKAMNRLESEDFKIWQFDTLIPKNHSP